MRSLTSDADDLRLFLDILRRIDLPRAKREADALAARLDVTASVLAECVNVLATYADDLTDDQFGPVADRILAWADRFDRAPGRERVMALPLALFQFNRGLVLLRLGRAEDARDALGLARAVDPIIAEIQETMRLTVYDQHVRDLAARVRARPIAASAIPADTIPDIAAELVLRAERRQLAAPSPSAKSSPQRN